MRITHLHAINFRNIKEVKIEPGQSVNVFTGPNASGKTAILESIHVLSRGKSFRASRVKDIIQHGQESLQVVATLESKASRLTSGIAKQQGKTTIHYDGETVKQLSKQAKNIPVLCVLPDSHQLITGDPKARRHWMDWAMFHVKQDYLETWKTYHRALRHRNVLLKKTHNDDELIGWERSMVDCAQSIDKERRYFLSKIGDTVRPILIAEGWEEPEIGYEKGWPATQDLGDVLRDSRAQDKEVGYTRFGIHRSDITFKVNNNAVSRHYSRGQVKKYVACLILSQLYVMRDLGGETPVFLVDDFAAEIDAHTRRRLVERLLDCGSQVFMTMTELEPQTEEKRGITRFHVKHGTFDKVVE